MLFLPMLKTISKKVHKIFFNQKNSYIIRRELFFNIKMLITT